MGRLPLSVLASGAAHVAFLAWIVGQTPPRRAPVGSTIPPRAVVPIDVVPIDVPMDVVPIEIDLVAPPPPTPVAGVSRTSRFGATSHTPRGEPSTVVVEDVDKPATPPSPVFSMRGNGRTDLTLPARFRDELAAGTPPRIGTAATGKLAPDGTSFKSDQGPFVAHVARDGSVTLHDRSAVSVRSAIPSLRMIGRGIAEWYLSDKGPDGKRGKQTLAHMVGGSIDPGGGDFTKVDSAPATILPVLRGGLAIDDWLSRRTVGDPYASKKLAFLDATRDERMEIGAAHRRQLLRETAILTRQNLERAWAGTTDAAARKQALFELWDEIVEPDGGDELVAEASRAARAQIIGFIRARLPSGSSDAYSTDELAAFARTKQSRAAFAPYE